MYNYSLIQNFIFSLKLLMNHVFFLHVRQMNNEFVIFQTQESAVMIYWLVSCCARQQEDLTLEVLFPKQYTQVGIGRASGDPHLSVEQLLLARVWDMVMEPWAGQGRGWEGGTA